MNTIHLSLSTREAYETLAAVEERLSYVIQGVREGDGAELHEALRKLRRELGR